MNKKKLMVSGLRIARRNPRATLSVLAFAARHRRGIAKTVKAGMATSRGLRHAKQAAAEPAARAEFGAAISALAATVGRARQVGIRKSLDDKKAARSFDRTVEHASRAWKAARKQKHRHTFGIATLGLGLVAGAYGVMKLHHGEEQ